MNLVGPGAVECRGVRQRAVHLACAGSLLVCLATLAFIGHNAFQRSYHFQYMGTDGIAQLILVDGMFFGLRVYDDPRFLPEGHPDRGWRLFTAPAGPAFGATPRFWVMRNRSGWIVHLPLWTVAAAAGVLPAVAAMHAAYRRVRRRAAGTCGVCGYDLRASPVRCPECGMVTTKPAE